jgi:surfeit locus 1 family protein
LTAIEPGPWRRLAVPGLGALIGIAVLVGLGSWQMQRKAWKEALIDTIARRIAVAPQALPSRDRWNQLVADHDEFRRVTFSAGFFDGSALVYTAGSALRPDVSGPGYWVFAPARLADGSPIVVNRGFLPLDQKDRIGAEMTEPVLRDIVGVLRWPERPGWFTPADEPSHNLWFARDHLAIAAAKGWGAVAPFYVDQEAPTPPDGLPRPGRDQPGLPNNHLSYAITWFGLAIVLAGVFAAFVRAQLREP